MNLLNRYLQEVSRHLPKAKREDIVAELRANISSHIEDREEELGRPLTEKELLAMLQHHGNPMIVAGRYRPHNLGLAFGIQLIGPELFPFYRMILLLNFCITLVILAVVLPIVVRELHTAVTLGRLLTPFAAQFAAVTLIFIALEHGKDHVLNRWDPGKLPPLKAMPEDGPTSRNIFNFIAAAVGTVWLALTPRWPYLLLGPAALYLPALQMTPMPEWISIYWELIALLCIQLVPQFVTLVRLAPSRPARIADLILKCWGLKIGVILLLKYPNYVRSPYPEIADWTNLSFLICVIVAVGINLFGIVRQLLRLRPQARAVHYARRFRY
jgi:hypothetical protein